VQASAVATGTGMVRAAHGMLPNPAPAVVGLLRGVPTWGRDIAVELTTPTGAALLAALSSGFGPMPAMEIRSQGFGAGTRELEELPNCTQVVVGTRTGAGAGFRRAGGPEADAGQPVAVLEVTVDDATGEQLAHAVSQLLDAGAHDAWIAPVLMKKGRPGHVVHVLCDPVSVPEVRAVLRAGTGSLGVRMSVSERWPASRTVDSVVVDGQPIRVKVGAGRVKAEHDDVAGAARRTGRPLRELATKAEAAWMAGQGNGGGVADGPDVVGQIGPRGRPGIPVDAGTGDDDPDDDSA
jgi:pyridinium-3,5-bisthiocarboxylic acid mononucleotide nickel chelatase